MGFAAPYLLFALVAVPFAVLGYAMIERRRTTRSAHWSRLALLPNMILGGKPGRRRYLTAAMFLLALTFLLVGFARPQRLHSSGAATSPTVVVAVDVSGSMAADDVEPTRVRAAGVAAARLIRELPARDRIAVVTFGNQAHLVVPPTADRSAALASLPKAVTPRAGTAIGDAIKEAVAVIVQGVGSSHQSGRPGAILLLSDGAQTAGGATPEDAALYAHADGIPIDTVPIGTEHGSVTVRENGVETQAPVPPDRAVLSRIASQTGGTMITDPSTAQLKAVYAGLGARSASNHREEELSALTAGIALLLTIAGIVFSGVWFGEVA
jgi:Ca-activated chloride channel family protein